MNKKDRKLSQEGLLRTRPFGADGVYKTKADLRTKADKEKRADEIKLRLMEIQSSLDELKAKRQSKRYRAGGAAVASYDPDMAQKYFNMANNIDQNSAELAKDDSGSGMSPQTIRMKLFSSANALSNQMSQMSPNSDNYKRAKRMQNWMYDESNKENPTLRMPLEVIDNTVIADTENPPENSNLNLADDTKIVNKAIHRGGDISTIATDWYTMEDNDGAKKPTLRDESLAVNNMPKDVRDGYNDNLAKWNKNNDSAKASGSAAKARKKGEAIAKRLAAAAPKTREKLATVRTQLDSLMEKYNNGSFSLANFADLKATMADGRMTDGDVSVGTGMTVAEGFQQRIGKFLTGDNYGNGKLKNKENAWLAITRTIDMYNETVEGMTNPQFTGKYAKYAKQAWDENSYNTGFGNLGKMQSIIGAKPNKNGKSSKSAKKIPPKPMRRDFKKSVEWRDARMKWDKEYGGKN